MGKIETKIHMQGVTQFIKQIMIETGKYYLRNISVEVDAALADSWRRNDV